jgi:hypothetical protein
VHAVSDRFLKAVQGSYRSAYELTLCDPIPQFGTNPTGYKIPVVDGTITLSSLTDIKSTATVMVPGNIAVPGFGTPWDAFQPFGAELYVKLGVEYANGERELVPLGYHRIEQVTQNSAPFGPIEIIALDRIAQIQQNNVQMPIPLNDGNSHRDVFERLVNGISIPQQATFPGVSPSGPGAYNNARIPISWTGYNPDKTVIVGDQIVQDSTYNYLADLIHIYNSAIRFNNDGGMEVFSLLVDYHAAKATLTAGRGGNVITVQRTTKRTGVSNICTAYGTDPNSITDFIISYNSDSASPLAWNSTQFPNVFGPATTYYSSPLLQTDGDVVLAGEALLRRFRALPLVYTLQVIPNPALQPFDPIDVIPWPDYNPTRAIIDTMTLPLNVNKPAQIITRIPLATEGLQLGLGVLA